MSQTRTRKPNAYPENARCCACGLGTVDGVKFNRHHIQYRSEGGSNDVSNLELRCVGCHTALHSANGDYRRWGAQGGTKASRDPYRMRNLRQFRKLSDEQFEAYVQAKYAIRVETLVLVQSIGE